MDRGGSKIGNLLRISAVLIIMTLVLLGILVQGSRTQAPTIVSMTPAANSFDALSKTPIAVQFSAPMDPGASWIYVWDESNQGVAGTFHWTTTAFTNDTLIFTPSTVLRPETHYSFQGIGQSAAGGTWFTVSFTTRVLTADTTSTHGSDGLPPERKVPRDQAPNLELSKALEVQERGLGIGVSSRSSSPKTISR
jgi:hypothetical protein